MGIRRHIPLALFAAAIIATEVATRCWHEHRMDVRHAALSEKIESLSEKIERLSTSLSEQIERRSASLSEQIERRNDDLTQARRDRSRR